MGAPMAAYSGCGERDGGERTRQEALADRTGASLRGRWGTGGRAPSGWEWNGSQPGQGATELGFPRPAPWQMQGEAACRAGKPSGHREEASPQGLGGHQLLAQTDARCPTGQVVRQHLGGQPGGVGGEAPRRKMIQPHAVLQVSNGVLDLGMAAMVGLRLQRVSLSRSVMKP